MDGDRGYDKRDALRWLRWEECEEERLYGWRTEWSRKLDNETISVNWVYWVDIKSLSWIQLQHENDTLRFIQACSHTTLTGGVLNTQLTIAITGGATVLKCCERSEREKFRFVIPLVIPWWRVNLYRRLASTFVQFSLIHSAQFPTVFALQRNVARLRGH